MPSIQFWITNVIILIIGGVMARLIYEHGPQILDYLKRFELGDIPKTVQFTVGGLIIGVVLTSWRQILEFVASFLSKLGVQIQFPVNTDTILLLLLLYLAFAVSQMLIRIQWSMDRIDNRLESLDENIQMAVDDSESTDGDGSQPVQTDGGTVYEPEGPEDPDGDGDGETSGTGLLGGALAGGAVGSAGGPGGAILGAIIGAALGDTIEQESIKGQKKKEIKLRVIEKLLRKNVVGMHSNRKETILSWFPSHERGLVKETIEEMVEDPDNPVQDTGGIGDSIQLTNREEARTYLVNNGGNLPWDFD